MGSQYSHSLRAAHWVGTVGQEAIHCNQAYEFIPLNQEGASKFLGSFNFSTSLTSLQPLHVQVHEC
jgi:hypothetical protein